MSLYGASDADLEFDPLLEQRRIDLIHSAATLLDKNSLVRYERKTGQLQATDLGRVAAYYYVTHQTVAVYNDYLKPTLCDIDVLRLFSLSADFTHAQDAPFLLPSLLTLFRRGGPPAARSRSSTFVTEGGADEEEVGSDCDLLELTLRSKQIGGMPSGGALNSAESFRSRSRAPIVAPILTESSAGGFSSMSELL